MKTKVIYIVFLFLTVSFFQSCYSDLDTLPLDDNQLIAENVFNTSDGYKGALAKCYASFELTGQIGPGGDRDVPNIDEGYSGYSRALFYLQVAATDEVAFHAGSGHGTRAMLYMNWDPSTPVISYPYYRLYMSIGYANEFLRETTEAKLKARGVYEDLKNEYAYMQAEARFLRAYSYSVICDLYGSAPFVDETMPVGIIPAQKTRVEIFNYVVSELEAIQAVLKEPGKNEYGRVDRVAAWFLLSRVYLNSESWVGVKHYEDSYKYAKMVIDNSNYQLASDYRHIFLADNHTCPEIIWPLVNDGDYAQSHAGTNFLVKAMSSGAMNSFYLTGIGTQGWGNARAKTNLVNLFDSSDQIFRTDDPWGDNKKDKRAQFFTVGHSKETWRAGRAFENTFTVGYALMKYRNVTKQRVELIPGGNSYTSIDLPMFRKADAYLMAAEAILRGASGSRAQALSYVNEIRDRAYMSGKYGNGISGAIADHQLTLDFILDERGRELYTELVRRTDLIRFGRYTKGYNWDWKGSDGTAGNFTGKDVQDKYKLFPIPQDEFTVNPYLNQNPDF
jgi:starch-binding outer membrane protein, SusD/RagB family